MRTGVMIFCLVSVISLSVTACGSGKSLGSNSIPTTTTNTSLTADPSIFPVETITILPTSPFTVTPTTRLTSAGFPIIATPPRISPSLEPSQTPYHTGTSTPIPAQVIKPSNPLEQTSVESILEWIYYGVGLPDITVFEILATPSIDNGPYASEPTGSYTREQFLEEIRQRITSHPSCVSYQYEYQNDAIIRLYVRTRDWYPAWEYPGSGLRYSSNCVVFRFSNYNGFFITGVFNIECEQEIPRGTPFP